jgi:hypothetical protein
MQQQTVTRVESARLCTIRMAGSPRGLAVSGKPGNSGAAFTIIMLRRPGAPLDSIHHRDVFSGCRPGVAVYAVHAHRLTAAGRTAAGNRPACARNQSQNPFIYSISSTSQESAGSDTGLKHLKNQCSGLAHSPDSRTSTGRDLHEVLQKKAFRAIKNSFNIFYIVLSYAC